MSEIKECITDQDYVEAFDRLNNAGITKVRICYSECWEREDDGKRISGSTVDYVALGKEDDLDEIIIEGGWTPKKNDESLIENVNMPNLIFTKSLLAVLMSPVHSEYEKFADDKDSAGYFHWDVSSRTITLEYDGVDKFRDSDPDQFVWWSEQKYKQDLERYRIWI